MSQFRRPRRVLAGLALMLALAAAPAPAAASPLARPVVAAPVVVAESFSWSGFVRYWAGFVHRSDRVVLVVGLVAGAALFIITRGKWIK